jgi:dienelactone hydrolase
MAAMAQFPDQANHLHVVASTQAAVQGDADTAVRLLREALAHGYFVSEFQWGDPDFNPIRENPDFIAVRAESARLREAAQANARPERLTIVPGAAIPDPVPLLIALHGNFSSIRWHRAHWETAARAGWLVALPQSDEVAGLDSEGNLGYVWDDVPRATSAITGVFGALDRAYPLASAQTVIGGFSRGGEMAVQMAVTGAVPVKAFVAVCPGGPLSEEPDLWEPIVAQGANRDLRGLVIMGEQDRFTAGTERLVTLLTEAGIDVEFERHAGLGHDYPAGFGDRLPQILAGLVE